MERSAEIKFTVELDAAKVPVSMQWEASEAPSGGPRDCEAISLSMWDPHDRNTMGIDLWTPKMTISEMNFFMLQSFVRLAESYRRATSNEEIADLLDDFGVQLTSRLEKDALKSET